MNEIGQKHFRITSLNNSKQLNPADPQKKSSSRLQIKNFGSITSLDKSILAKDSSQSKLSMCI